MNHIAVFSRLVSWQVENPPHPYTAYNSRAKKCSRLTLASILRLPHQGLRGRPLDVAVTCVSHFLQLHATLPASPRFIRCAAFRRSRLNVILVILFVANLVSQATFNHYFIVTSHTRHRNSQPHPHEPLYIHPVIHASVKKHYSEP